MKPCKNSLTTSLRKDISVSPNRPMHHHSSLFTRRMARCDQYKTTGRSTPSPYETNIPFCSSPISYVISATLIYIQSLTSDGGIITCVFVKEMKRKPHLRHDTDFLSQR